MATPLGKVMRVLFVSLIYVAVYSLMQVGIEAVIGFIGMYQALPYVSGRGLWQVFDESVISGIYFSALLAMALSMLAFWAMGILRERRLSQELSFCGARKTPVVPAVLVACGCRLMVSLYTMAADYVPALRESAENAANLEAGLRTPLQLVLYLATITVIGPIFEEILFRGLIQTELLRGFPPSAAITVGALIFAAAHGVLFQAVFAFFVGLAFGWCYYVTKNLLVSMIVHIVFNATALVTETFVSLTLPMMGICALAGAAMTVAGLIWIYRKK